MSQSGRFPSLVTTSLALITLALSVGGCRDRYYDFGVRVVPPDGEVLEVGRPDVSFDTQQPFGGSGGRAGAGGSAGRGGAGGSSVAGSGGSVPSCNDNSPDRLTDISNCGTCFHSCLVPNADPVCQAGVCKANCFTDFFDADKDPKNGCECVKTNAGVEACDGLDNDCNGTVDDGFDFASDPANCGGCNVPCSFPFATGSCMNSVCVQGACLAGFYDRDPKVPGCETACTKTNGGVEICDGLDNDCNGTIDDNLQAATITCRSMGVCAGVTPKCMGTSSWVCTYPSTFQDVEDMTKTCDGLDNDCDGKIDEPFQIGKACTVGSGPCAGTGTWVCDNTMAGNHRCMGSTKTPGTEVCNGLDDDCDGKVDELDSMSNKTSDDKLVYFAGKDVTMFAHEASRYDANGTSHGFDSTGRPCSVSGRQPWSNVTKEEAQAACKKIGTGWRLCTAAEWSDGCNGTSTTNLFPYGANYVANSCNGWDYVSLAARTGNPTATPPVLPVTTFPTGAATMCLSDITTTDKLYDMSGNVKEWVATDLTTTTTTPACTTPPCLFEMRGGAYDIASFTIGTATPHRAGHAVRRLCSGARHRGPSPLRRVPMLSAREAPQLMTRTSQMNLNRALMVGTLTGLALAAGAAHAEVLRPNIMILLDTSGSMLYNQAYDGSPLCNDTTQHTTQGRSSRVYNMKNAIRSALTQVGTDEANFGLMRFPQIETAASGGCPEAHWSNDPTNTTVGTHAGCKMTKQTATDMSYGTWFDDSAPEAFMVPVTKPTTGLKGLAATDYDPIGANITTVFKWIDQSDSGLTGTSNTDPELRIPPNTYTPLGRSMFYSRMYFENYVYPNDPKKSCRQNILIIATDGAETCDETGGNIGRFDHLRADARQQLRHLPPRASGLPGTALGGDPQGRARLHPDR